MSHFNINPSGTPPKKNKNKIKNKIKNQHFVQENFALSKIELSSK